MQATVRLVVAYLKIMVWTEPLLALGMVLSGALQGAGETVSPTMITVVTMIVFRLPVAWFLAASYGAVGGWWAMAASTTLQGILTVIVFQQGRWQRIKV